MRALQFSRERHAFFDEIHFREIRGRSPQNKAFLVAQDWIRDYFTTFVKGCPFKAFIAEDGSARTLPYPGDIGYPEHLLQSTKAAFKGGIAWSYHRETQLRLRIVNDDSDSELDRSVGTELSAMLQSECNTRRLRGSKRYPWLRVEPAEFVSSNPKEVGYDRLAESEFIQLCDLLLGATFSALELKSEPSNRAGRRQLAQSIMAVLADTVRVPWLQYVPVHRKFSVSLYPDNFNFAYPAALRSARIRGVEPQMRLPGLE